MNLSFQEFSPLSHRTHGEEGFASLVVTVVFVVVRTARIPHRQGTKGDALTKETRLLRAIVFAVGESW